MAMPAAAMPRPMSVESRPFEPMSSDWPHARMRRMKPARAEGTLRRELCLLTVPTASPRRSVKEGGSSGGMAEGAEWVRRRCR